MTTAEKRKIESRYDMEGRKVSELNGTTLEFDRRRDGELIEYIKNERGLITKYDYDNYRNVLNVEHPDNSIESWTYLPIYSGVYVHNLKGEKESETITFGKGAGAFSKTLTRTYEANGLLKSLTYPGTIGSNQYTYDRNNQIKTYVIHGFAANNNTLTYQYRWNAVDSIEAAKVWYNPFMTNSNATVSQTISSVGLNPGLPPAQAPGWLGNVKAQRSSIDWTSDCCE